MDARVDATRDELLGCGAEDASGWDVEDKMRGWRSLTSRLAAGLAVKSTRDEGGWARGRTSRYMLPARPSRFSRQSAACARGPACYAGSRGPSIEAHQHCSTVPTLDIAALESWFTVAVALDLGTFDRADCPHRAHAAVDSSGEPAPRGRILASDWPVIPEPSTSSRLPVPSTLIELCC
jgi:hypothetical protein